MSTDFCLPIFFSWPVLHNIMVHRASNHPTCAPNSLCVAGQSKGPHPSGWSLSHLHSFLDEVMGRPTEPRPPALYVFPCSQRSSLHSFNSIKVLLAHSREHAGSIILTNVFSAHNPPLITFTLHMFADPSHFSFHTDSVVVLDMEMLECLQSCLQEHHQGVKLQSEVF